MTGEDTSTDAGLRLAAERFAGLGVSNVLLTLGERGAWLDGRVFEAAQVDVVDTTAAGDVFAGYLGAALADGQGLDDALRVAMAACSLAVTRVGASASVPQRAEVEAFVGG